MTLMLVSTSHRLEKNGVQSASDLLQFTLLPDLKLRLRQKSEPKIIGHMQNHRGMERTRIVQNSKKKKNHPFLDKILFCAIAKGQSSPLLIFKHIPTLQFCRFSCCFFFPFCLSFSLPLSLFLCLSELLALKE